MASQTNTAPNFSDWGRECVSMIEARFVVKNGRHVEWVDAQGKQSEQPSFLWGMGVTLSAYAAAARVGGKDEAARFEKLWGEVRKYGTGSLEEGLSVLPGQTEPDRYYDDNAWVVLALSEAGEWLKNPGYIREAERVFRYVLSGEDEKLGGGIYWRERAKGSKNACSNGPAALVAFRLARVTGKNEYKTIGDRIMEWLRLVQDKDGLFFDAIRSDGTPEKTKWSYNAALPLRARLERFRLLKERKDLDEARRIGEAALARWVDPQTGLIKDDASFAHHLAEAFLELGGATGQRKWIDAAYRSIIGLHQSIRTQDGLYGKWWDRRQPPSDRFLLLYQSSAARAYGMAAASQRGQLENPPSPSRQRGDPD